MISKNILLSLQSKMEFHKERIEFLKKTMHTNKLIFIGIILWLISDTAFAQNSTNTPHTRYGYGVLADKAFISQRGMGGIGYGLRNSQMINPMNPASFSSVDSMTFMFDLGVTGQMVWLKDGLENERKINGNLEYMAMQFPLAKKIGVGIGFEPVSYVGYNYGDIVRLALEEELASTVYNGGGGFSKVYGALSYDLLDRISFGVKVSYLFGDIIHDKFVRFSSQSGNYNTNWTDTIRGNGLLYDFGLQYHQPVGRFKSITVGAIYSPKISYGAKVMTGSIISDASGSIMDRVHTLSKDSVFELPETYGLGFTYNQLGKMTVGADVLYQRWADVKFFNQSGAFSNRLKLNAGGEYIPLRTSNNMLNRLRYRAGLYYANSYQIIKDSKYNEYGANLGLGIPMPDRRSFLNLAFEYSRVMPKTNTLIEEQYFKVSLSYTFNESWFFKRKLQ